MSETWWKYERGAEWHQHAKIPELYRHHKNGTYRVGNVECVTKEETIPLLDAIYPEVKAIREGQSAP